MPPPIRPVRGTPSSYRPRGGAGEGRRAAVVAASRRSGLARGIGLMGLIGLCALVSPEQQAVLGATPVESRQPATAASAGATTASTARAEHPASEKSVTATMTRRLMGVPWTITAHAADGPAAAPALGRAIGRALDEVERLEGVLSDYDPESELSRLSAAAPVTRVVSGDLWHALETSRRFRDLTGGAFDPTVGPLTSLWRQSRRSGRLPDPDRLARARAACGPETFALDAATKTVRLTRPGMRLDLGGIGMGLAADAAMRVLREAGIRSAMIDASGDILVSGPPPGRQSWRIRVERLRTRTSAGAAPAARASGAADPAGLSAEGRSDKGAGEPLVIELVDAAVTTSGDAFQAVEIDGVRYGHIVDPRTGLGVRGPLSVTVIGRDCTTADAMATAACVLGPVEGLRLIESFPGAAAAFQWLEDGNLRRRTSSRWPTLRPQP
jgi:thiamine biosynthesis lipoprotein